VRRLQQDDFSVQVVMTRGAREFVTPLTFCGFEWQKVITDLFAGPEAAVTRIWTPRSSNTLPLHSVRTCCSSRLRQPHSAKFAQGMRTISDNPFTLLRPRRWCCAGDECEHVESRGDAGESGCAALARSARRQSRRRLSCVRMTGAGRACGAGTDWFAAVRDALRFKRDLKADRADYGWADL